jgi:hypothetical protein
MADYDAMLYVGIYAGDSKDDAEQYLIAKGLLKPTELEVIYGDDIQSLSDMGFPLNVQCENYYSGRGWYVGYETSPESYQQFDRMKAEFKKLTGDDAEVLSFTQVS